MLNVGHLESLRKESAQLTEVDPPLRNLQQEIN